MEGCCNDIISPFYLPEGSQMPSDPSSPENAFVQTRAPLLERHFLPLIWSSPTFTPHHNTRGRPAAQSWLIQKYTVQTPYPNVGSTQWYQFVMLWGCQGPRCSLSLSSGHGAFYQSFMYIDTINNTKKVKKRRRCQRKWWYPKIAASTDLSQSSFWYWQHAG